MYGEQQQQVLIPVFMNEIQTGKKKTEKKGKA